jgi:hypothetical protein
MEPQQTAPDNQPTGQPVNPPPAEPQVRVPPSWPGAFGLFKYSKEAVKLNFWTLAAFWLVSIVASIVLSRAGNVGSLLSFVVSCFAAAGYTLAWIAGVRARTTTEFRGSCRPGLQPSA